MINKKFPQRYSKPRQQTNFPKLIKKLTFQVSWKHQYHRRPNPRPLPFGFPASGHTLRKPATQPQCRERARECTSRPAESEKEKEQDGQVPGADGINKHRVSFLETKSVAL